VASNGLESTSKRATHLNLAATGSGYGQRGALGFSTLQARFETIGLLIDRRELGIRGSSGGGRLAMVGIFTGDQTVNANAIVERELEVRGCSVCCEEQREALELLPELAATLKRVIAPSEALDQLPQLYERLIAGQSPYLKTIVEP
jgi:threonine dehydrogenase-like Zn-dependent dehydrogenase